MASLKMEGREMDIIKLQESLKSLENDLIEEIRLELMLRTHWVVSDGLTRDLFDLMGIPVSSWISGGSRTTYHYVDQMSRWVTDLIEQSRYDSVMTVQDVKDDGFLGDRDASVVVQTLLSLGVFSWEWFKDSSYFYGFITDVKDDGLDSALANLELNLKHMRFSWKDEV